MRQSLRFARSLLACCALGVVVGTAAGAAPEPSRTAAEVDRLLAAELFPPGSPDAKRLAPRADDETFLRRVSLDLCGQLPTPGEITALALDPAQDKRAQVVERLLASPGYGQNWGRYWRDVVLYRRSDDRGLIVTSALTQFLTDEINQNTSWDQIARAFITASGEVTTEGATGIIMAQMGVPEDTVAEISRIFLGIQIQCAQCHDHPTDRWKRIQFHELAAFFPRVAVRPNRSSDKRTFEVAATDSPALLGNQFNGNRFRGTPEHYMPDLNDPSSKGTLVTPVLFVTGQKLPAGTRDVDRRGSLADWITARDNPWFAKAVVNRYWAELVGEGFYEPVDDLGPDRQCVAPQTLDYLAGKFADSGYDVKWLLKTITSTEAYQRESRSPRNPDETPFLANGRQRLRGDQIYSALATALGINESLAGRGVFGGGNPYLSALATPRGQFNRVFGYDPSSRRDEIAGSIPQALLLMNSQQVNSLVGARGPGALGQLLAETTDDQAVVAELYLRCLAREPNPVETKTALEYVKDVGNRGEAFEDLLWTLVNSAEFLHRR